MVERLALVSMPKAMSAGKNEAGHNICGILGAWAPFERAGRFRYFKQFVFPSTVSTETAKVPKNGWLVKDKNYGKLNKKKTKTRRRCLELTD